ncbi:MAG TPA: gamma-glutamyltransferase family protein [Candidatus Dormibacteraeota bacterium]|nr:gamma-glutamyltransferase family protein [Candidatus Dormibacteraeota bacterium]
MTKGVVATPHRLASEAGAQVMRDGGNAIDAAIAADAVLCVVYPHMTSVGGDLMAIVWPAGAAAPIGLIGAGRSGELATIDAVRARGHDEMPDRGALSVTVPGTVEAWGRLLERFGSLGMGAVLDPAAALARDGFVITQHLSDDLKEEAELLGREPAAQALYPPMEAGMLLRNPDLASVLTDIGRHGINTFYRGAVGAAIAEALRRRDGFVTSRDLATHRSQWVDPVAVEYRGLIVYELPPPTQGLTASAMLARLRRFDRHALEPGAAFIAAFKKVRDESYALRDRYITDPDFSPAPFEPFLDPMHAIADTGGHLRDGGDTIYLCAADEHGNLVSLIQSVSYGFGSGVVAEGTGMLLQNRGCYFKLDPAHVNRLEPKKRTMHTLIPAMAAREGRPWASFGSMGGDGQPQLQTQVLMNLVDHGLEPAEAVARPRVRVQADGKKISVEADYPGAGELNRSGLNIELMPPNHHTLGHAHAILVDGPGSWRAGADPRSDGSVERSP